MTNWDLIAKYLAGEATESEKKDVDRWLLANPSHQNIFKELKNAMRPGSSNEPHFGESMNEDWIQLQGRIASQKPIERETAWITWYKIAAVFILLGLVGIGTWYSTKDVIRNDGQQLASLDSVKNFLLPDGSQIWLNKHARVIIGDFSKTNRRVTLEGEAYFEVVKDKSKPFIVTSGSVVTTVLGTAFNVNSKSDGSVKVTVAQGKVSVNKEKTKVFLLPGDVATYRKTSDALLKAENDDLNFLTWKTGVIRFEDEPLVTVCAYLAQYYHTDIHVKNTALEKSRVTTTFDKVGLDQALSILSVTLDLKIEKTDSVIYLVE